MNIEAHMREIRTCVVLLWVIGVKNEEGVRS